MKQPLIFVTYAIALLAQQKGFTEPCLIYYDEKGRLGNPCKNVEEYYNKLHIKNLPNDYWVINSEYNVSVPAAPTYEQILDWLRKEFKIAIIPYPASETHWNCRIIQLSLEEEEKGYMVEHITKNGYYEALNYSIIKILKDI